MDRKNCLTGLEKFISMCSIFRARNFICASDRARKKKKKNRPVKPKSKFYQETSKNIEFCSLLPK